MTSRRYRLTVCGGTFDLFHSGHEKFLDAVFKDSEKVIIGLASDDFSSKKNIFESYELRKKTLMDFINKNKYSAEIVKIDDLYGPTLSNKRDYDVIFVTKDSLGGAIEINKRREELKLSKLVVKTVNIEKATDGKNISSNRIRKGEIDRNGNLYIDEEFVKFDYILPEELREKLSQPFGELKKNLNDFDIFQKPIISIGDVTTQKFLEKKIVPELSIIDLKVNRIKRFESFQDLGFSDLESVKVENPAAHITSDLIKEVVSFFKSDDKNFVIEVNGEEDLAVIPVVLSAPLKSEVYYGQPEKGVVRIIVTEDIKKEIKEIVSKFERKVL